MSNSELWWSLKTDNFFFIKMSFRNKWSFSLKCIMWFQHALWFNLSDLNNHGRAKLSMECTTSKLEPALQMEQTTPKLEPSDGTLTCLGKCWRKNCLAVSGTPNLVWAQLWMHHNWVSEVPPQVIQVSGELSNVYIGRESKWLQYRSVSKALGGSTIVRWMGMICVG